MDFPCPPLPLQNVTQADATPGICKLDLLPLWGVGEEGPQPTPITLGPTPWDLG